jgi:hypothetical protein
VRQRDGASDAEALYVTATYDGAEQDPRPVEPVDVDADHVIYQASVPLASAEGVHWARFRFTWNVGDEAVRDIEEAIVAYTVDGEPW